MSYSICTTGCSKGIGMAFGTGAERKTNIRKAHGRAVTCSHPIQVGWAPSQLTGEMSWLMMPWTHQEIRTNHITMWNFLGRAGQHPSLSGIDLSVLKEKEWEQVGLVFLSVRGGTREEFTPHMVWTCCCVKGRSMLAFLPAWKKGKKEAGCEALSSQVFFFFFYLNGVRLYYTI